MNVALYVIGQVREKGTRYATSDDAHLIYKKMLGLSVTSIVTHLKGLDSVVVLNHDSETWYDLLYTRFRAIYEYSTSGDNVLLCDADTLLVKPLDLDWQRDHLTLWDRAYCAFPDRFDEATYRTCGQAFFPANLDHFIWRQGLDYITNYDGSLDRHDIEQCAYNIMYFAQEPDIKADTDPRMNCYPYTKGSTTSDAYFLHFPATRDIHKQYSAMCEVAK